MITIQDAIRLLHGLNRWLALAVAVWVMGQWLFGVFARKPVRPNDQRAITLMLAVVGAQAVLGALLFWLMGQANFAAFGGRTGTQWAHIGAGVLAVVFGGLAVLTSRGAITHRAAHIATTILGCLALLMLGKLPLALSALAVWLLVQFVLHRRAALTVASNKGMGDA